MKKHLKTLATAMLCLAMALLVSCDKDKNKNKTLGGDTGGDTPTSTPTVSIEGHGCVDLGLPSGLLWATCNVGATNPEDCGDYFAWGDTLVKSVYNWKTYQWCDSSKTTQTKYCTKEDYGKVDSLTYLEPEDDAANVNWGGGWCMPTETEFNELMKNCDKEWTTQEGVNGLKVTGSNGNSIFLPAAGFYHYSVIDYIGSYGDYWSKSLDTVNQSRAYYLGFSSGEVYMRNDRCYGLSVRPVHARQN